MAKRKRDIQLKVRVTPEERAMIEAKMAQLGTTNMGAYLRKMAIDGYVVKLDLPELRELVSLLRYSSNNLNQLARRVHETGRVYAADMDDILQNQERIWQAASGILSRLAAIRYENLYYLAALLHTPNKDQIRRAMYKVGLDPDSRKKVKHYSLGMKQRLGIAQAIMDNPAIMVLDEPFNGLDKASANDICNLLCSLKDQGKLIILAMHLSKDYADFYDQAYEIVSGKLKPYVLHGSKSII